MKINLFLEGKIKKEKFLISSLLMCTQPCKNVNFLNKKVFMKLKIFREYFFAISESPFTKSKYLQE